MFVQILGRNIVHGNFSGGDFSDVWICRILHRVDNFGLESLAFFDQVSNALGICFPDTGQSLKIAGLLCSIQLQFGLIARVVYWMPSFFSDLPCTGSHASLICISMAE